MVGMTRKTLGAVVTTTVLATMVAGTAQAQSPSAAAPATGVNEAALTHTFDWGEFTLAPRIVEKAAAGQPLNIVVNNVGTAIPVFGAEQLIGTDRGCEANADRLSIACRLTGPPTTDITAQLAELETLLTSDQVDCLGIASVTPDAYVDIVNKYVDAGIPVFTQNTDVPSSKRFAFYALNERDSGRVNGQVTAELVQAQGLAVNSVAMGSGNPAEQWAQDRMGGFAEGYRETFPDAVFQQEETTGLPTGINYTTQEVIDSVGPYLTSNPDVNLFFHTDQGVEGVGIVIRDNNLTGKDWTSGFNVSLPILDMIEAGQILVTINQGFDNQAEAAVNACVDYLADGTVPADPLAYLDPIVITKDGGEGRESAAQAREKLTAVLGDQ
jgi:ribose transport system substrate-binding protein